MIDYIQPYLDYFTTNPEWALIIIFLIVEPHGLARLWQLTKERLRLWPFPH